ncbi:tryptophan-rich sensory protein [Gluconobacter cerinus]|uniref:TspO/MBR family protein n=1 Tax=Gluconobacter cerinus TaxID=38307 RepID=UPI002226A20D|nr:TspO/MBR family protein [Gluconobacter cerinus]MCW2265870.1 tryptophan-rich sensory protein [Gluconobacter cerinus]
MGRIIDAALAAGTVFGAQYLGREISPAEDGSTRRWYHHLNKPEFSPPAPVYAVVWTFLDGLLAWSGYRLLRAERSCARTAALWLWAICVAGVAGFPFAVFRKRRLDAGLAICIGLVVTSGASIWTAKKADPSAAKLQIPFFVWLTFAVFVQEEVWRRN